MNVKERIWLIITEILTKLAVFFELDIEILTQQIITDNQQITNIINLDAIKSKE